MKKVLLFIVCIGLLARGNAHAYQAFTIVDLTGKALEKKMKNIQDENLKGLPLPFELIVGTLLLETYNERIRDEVQKVFETRIKELADKGGEKLIPYPVDSTRALVKGIFVKESDMPNIQTITAKARQMGILIPFGVQGKYHVAATEYLVKDCKVTLIMSYSSLPEKASEQGSAMGYQIFAPKSASCSPALVKKESRTLSDYLQRRFENVQ